MTVKPEVMPRTDFQLRQISHYVPNRELGARCTLRSKERGQGKISRTHHTKSTFAGDAALGMETSITRRDFLGAALLASGSALLTGMTPAELLAQDDDFTGYGGVGEYSTANGNTLGRSRGRSCNP